MNTKNRNKIGDQTNVRVEEVIDYDPLDTATRDDDDAWNTMEFFGKSDEAESDYQAPKVSQKELEKILKRAKHVKVGQSVLAVLR